MPVIAIVNRKGGSGKSTLAAHIAAWCAGRGSSVMLGDVDRQQSARSWLKHRDDGLPAIAPWTVEQNMLRVPAGISQVVLDTPGGLQGFELARVVMFSDAILMPVCSSVFDRESAAACHAELMTLPRVASGRCRLASIGMRIDARTHAARDLQDWSESLGLPFLGVLRETQLYVRILERGMTIFDLPPKAASADLAQWEPILAWLKPVLYPNHSNQSASAYMPGTEGSVVTARPAQAFHTDPALAMASRPGAASASGRLGSSLPGSLMPAQESLVHGSRLSLHGARPGTSSFVAPDKMSSPRAHQAGLQDGFSLPRLNRQAG